MNARDSESYQILFLEAAEDGMILADAQEKIADANQATFYFTLQGGEQ